MTLDELKAYLLVDGASYVRRVPTPPHDGGHTTTGYVEPGTRPGFRTEPCTVEVLALIAEAWRLHGSERDLCVANRELMARQRLLEAVDDERLDELDTAWKKSGQLEADCRALEMRAAEAEALCMSHEGRIEMLQAGLANEREWTRALAADNGKLIARLDELIPGGYEDAPVR